MAILYFSTNFGNVDPGNCLSDFTNLNEQIKNGYTVNFSNLHGECLFSQHYEESKHAFINLAKEAGARVVDYPIVSSEITQTFAFLEGNPNKVLLHLSGTHGVEAYAGSSIQLGVLRYLNSTGLYKSGNTATLPTIILIHAVNPYGFYHNRRTDEDNVDVNRNFLTEDEFTVVHTRDPNYSQYVELDRFINPTSLPFRFVILNDLYWLFSAAYYMVNYGSLSIKRAMVAGNYHKQTGYGFGGFKRSKSVNNILEVLQKVVPSTVTVFYLIDVHTGLGPSGVDTLMFNDVQDTEWIEKIYPSEFNHKNEIIGGVKAYSFGYRQERVSDVSASFGSNTAMTELGKIVDSGYELTIGTTNSLCRKFIAPHLKGRNSLCITQVMLSTEENLLTVFFFPNRNLEQYPPSLLEKVQLKKTFAIFGGKSTKSLCINLVIVHCFMLKGKIGSGALQHVDY